MGGYGKLDGDDGGNDAEDFLFLFFFPLLLKEGKGSDHSVLQRFRAPGSFSCNLQ